MGITKIQHDCYGMLWKIKLFEIQIGWYNYCQYKVGVCRSKLENVS